MGCIHSFYWLWFASICLPLTTLNGNLLNLECVWSPLFAVATNCDRGENTDHHSWQQKQKRRSFSIKSNRVQWVAANETKISENRTLQFFYNEKLWKIIKLTFLLNEFHLRISIKRKVEGVEDGWLSVSWWMNEGWHQVGLLLRNTRCVCVCGCVGVLSLFRP